MFEYDELISEVQKIISNQRKEFENTGGRFNIFKILNLGNAELVHSAFIAELLNPNGLHCQGSLFLDLFISRILPQCDNFHFDANSAKVKCEYDIGKISGNKGGRIDIYLKDKDNNEIVIENKIYAQDQYMQLVRYHNYAPNAIIIYLTLDGHEPNSDSVTDQKENKEMTNGEDFFCVSYSEDILQWLYECYQKVENKKTLAEGIAHYIRTVESLTGKNMTLHKLISQKLMEDPEKVKAALEIEDACLTLKKDIQMDFWNTLFNLLEGYSLSYQNVIPVKEGKPFSRVPQKVANVKELQTLLKKQIDRFSNCRYGLTFPIGEWGGYCLKWCVLVLNNIYYGFAVFDKEDYLVNWKEGNDISSKGKAVLMDFKEKFEKISSDENFPETVWLDSNFFVCKEEPKISFKENVLLKKYIDSKDFYINNICQKTKLSIDFGKDIFKRVIIGLNKCQ